MYVYVCMFVKERQFMMKIAQLRWSALLISNSEASVVDFRTRKQQCFHFTFSIIFLFTNTNCSQALGASPGQGRALRACPTASGSHPALGVL